MDQEKKLTKCCTICNKDLDLSNFCKLKSGKYGVHTQCRKCRSNKRKKLNFARKTEGTKCCLKCKKEKDVTEYHSDKSSRDGLQGYCPDCHFFMSQKWLSTFDGFVVRLFNDVKQNVKKRSKKLDVDITISDIKQLYEFQNGKCAITGKTMTRLAYTQQKNQHIVNKENISIDRIDSSKGYTKDNIQLTCAIVNRMKTDMTDDELLLWCNDIVNHNSEKLNLLLKK